MHARKHVTRHRVLTGLMQAPLEVPAYLPACPLAKKGAPLLRRPAQDVFLSVIGQENG